MTNKEKKKFLNQYTTAHKEITRLTEELSEWRNMATKITPTITDMPKSNGGGNKLQTAVERIIEIESELDERIDNYVDLRKDIDKAIETVEDETLQLLLRYRYIDGMKWEQIALEMNYNYRWTLRLHGKALDKLAIESHIQSML